MAITSAFCNSYKEVDVDKNVRVNPPNVRSQAGFVTLQSELDSGSITGVSAVAAVGDVAVDAGSVYVQAGPWVPYGFGVDVKIRGVRARASVGRLVVTAVSTAIEELTALWWARR